MNQSERQINNQKQKMKNYEGFPIKNPIWPDFLPGQAFFILMFVWILEMFTKMCVSLAYQ